MEICRSEGLSCQPINDIGHLSLMAGQARAADLLIIADSPQRQDLKAVRELFHRVLDADVPCLLLTYSTRRAHRESPGVNCLNKPFLADDLVEHIQRLLGRVGSVASSGEPTVDEPRSQDATQKVASEAIRVLVAEDNDIAAKVITTLLEKLGLAVALVRDGQEALERACAEHFFMAFVDLRMPRSDGIEFARIYRSREKSGVHLPIIALTANPAEEIKAQCLDAGMDGFLEKPVKQPELREIVGRYLVLDAGRPFVQQTQ
ncbi:MAG: response regulator [Pseudomonadota bacterium]|nr:response regulator [Pseudomonadota bacterium]